MFKGKDRDNDTVNEIHESEFVTNHSNKKHLFKQMNGETRQTQMDFKTQVHKKNNMK
ncbi:MAG: hypothetical protein K0R71_1002 [Bacillales bacterium]|jgi:hypothetical protein|nr:hypothetical protein [Bacillales bacterium]